MVTKTTLDVTRLPGSIGEIRGLLVSDKDRARFAAELEVRSIGDQREFAEWLEDWGAYAIGLHDVAYQESLALARSGRAAEIATVPAEAAHRRLGVQG